MQNTKGRYQSGWSTTAASCDFSAVGATLSEVLSDSALDFAYRQIEAILNGISCYKSCFFLQMNELINII